MPTIAHFIDVGQGNMVLLQLADGTVLLYDCNVTDQNERRVLGYLERILGSGRRIDVFVNSHRDADHMRGIATVHQRFPIRTVWDSGVTGTTPATSEYQAYMALRRSVPNFVVNKGGFKDFGQTQVRILNAQNDILPDDPNAQSIVMKVIHRSALGHSYGSLMLTGDSDANAWRRVIAPFHENDLRSSILLASHHGSISFFNDPADERYYYTQHIKHIQPDMTVVSVGPNPHGHPDANALELYERYSSGSDKGDKVFRTDQQGTMRLELNDQGRWALTPKQ